MSNPPHESSSDILVVDDTQVNLRLLSQMLTEHGYKVRAVLNGERALAAAQAAAPDLILLDIRMPEMDGYEVCQRLKADERTRHIPILFISALGETEDKVRAFALGGVDYITKPFQPDEVLARVQTHLALRSLQRKLEAANAELARQLAELEARNEELDAFAHTVAHDLKNPIASMMGFAELLQEGYDKLPASEQQASLRAIVQSADKMKNIVEGLLLLARVRKTDAQSAPLDMGSIVTEAQYRLADTIERSRAEIVLPTMWPAAMGHAPWVEEVWANYLSNAIQYGGTPPRVELGGETLPDGKARFWVRDNGNGIAPDDQARLFTPFTRLEQVDPAGHGLGLSIVRRIVEKLGGQVGVESQGAPGRGSLFSFTLPGATEHTR